MSDRDDALQRCLRARAADPRAHEPQPLPGALSARTRRDGLVGRPRLQVPQRPEARVADQGVLHRSDVDLHGVRHARGAPRRVAHRSADQVDVAGHELRRRHNRAARVGEGRQGNRRAGLRHRGVAQGVRPQREAAPLERLSSRTTSRTARPPCTARGERRRGRTSCCRRRPRSTRRRSGGRSSQARTRPLPRRRPLDGARRGRPARSSLRRAGRRGSSRASRASTRCRRARQGSA